MSTIDDRMAEIQKYADEGATYYRRLTQASGGLLSATLLDLAIDGNLWHMDLRRKPFAGNEELKAIAREARDAQAELRERLINVVWQTRLPD